jgi:tryptophan synthase alpha chain
MFSDLKAKGEGAFIPFVVLNDPDPETSKRILDALIGAGADALELGIAFSDPLADGPTIQKADLRALRNKTTLKSALNLANHIRRENEALPLGLLVYANIVERHGPKQFYKWCFNAGIDSVLIADAPLLEHQRYFDEAIACGIDPVLIAPPNLPASRYKAIAELGRGYTYVVTRSGVTGADEHLNLEHHALLAGLKKFNAPPPVFGFGIASPTHVKLALKEGALGVISGSQVVSIIEDNLNDVEAMCKKLTVFAKDMKAATKMALGSS